MNTKKLMLVCVFALIASTSFAATTVVPVNGLTSDQIAELNAQAERMRSPAVQAQTISTTVRRETAAWAELGTNIGSAMVSAAKEVGVAANEFSQTSLGKIVTGIVIYKVMGKDVLKIVVGGFILIFGLSVTLWVLTTKYFGEVKYEYQPRLWGLWHRRVVTEYNISVGNAANKCVFCGVSLAITLIVGLNIIF